MLRRACGSPSTTQPQLALPGSADSDPFQPALALKLPSAEEARVGGAKAVDPDVYDLCLKGKELVCRFSKTDLDAAEQHFQRALAKDPASAVAYPGMAGLWLARRQVYLAPPLDLLETAHAAREHGVPYIGGFPCFDPLPSEPRFQALLRQMKLPQ